jgi:carboxylesterase type B
MIYVSIQNRLEMFGFLAGSEIHENGDANIVLLDQRVVLDWILQNIVHFDSDPSKVAIWGGSAGDTSVPLQLTAMGATDTPPFCTRS